MGFPPEQLFPIVDGESAVRALTWIITEGEGTQSSPIDLEKEPAHYYQFEALLRGRELVEDPTSPVDFSYSGGVIRFVPARVYDMPDNPKIDDYAAGSDARRNIEAFSLGYSDMLRALQVAYDGSQEEMSNALALMGQLRVLARQALMSIDEQTGRPAGLSFEYMPP